MLVTNLSLEERVELVQIFETVLRLIFDFHCEVFEKQINKKYLTQIYFLFLKNNKKRESGKFRKFQK